MARQGIGTGSSPNDGTGDTLRAGAAKVNDNFSELYTFLGDGSNLTAVIGSGIATAGGTVGTGATILDFRGSGISTVTVSSGIATINITGGGGSSYSDSDVDTHLNTSSASASEVLSWTGSDYDWVAQSAGITTANINADTLNVTGISTLGVTSITNLTLQQLNATGISTLGVTSITNLTLQQLNATGISTFNGKTRILDDVEFHVGTNGVSGDYKFYRDSGNSYNIVYEDISGGEARFIGNVSGSGNESNFTFLKNTNTLTEFTQNGIKLYANNSEKLTTTGSGVNITGVCTATSFSGDGSALSGVTTTRSRTVVSGTTGSVGAAATTDLDITGFKSYGLLKVGISSAAWVRLYVDDASRTSDETRSYLVDPTPGSGLIAEVRTETAGISTFLMTPGIIGWNNDVSVGSTIYAAVTNNESSSATITVDLTVVKMED